VLLRSQAQQHGIHARYVRTVFEAAFREYGLPLRLRTETVGGRDSPSFPGASRRAHRRN
jgi:hypothetical protein